MHFCTTEDFEPPPPPPKKTPAMQKKVPPSPKKTPAMQKKQVLPKTSSTAPAPKTVSSKKKGIKLPQIGASTVDFLALLQKKADEFEK